MARGTSTAARATQSERQLPDTVAGIGHVEHGAFRIEPKGRRRDMFTGRSRDLRPMRPAVGGVEEALAILRNGGPDGVLVERIDSKQRRIDAAGKGRSSPGRAAV